MIKDIIINLNNYTNLFEDESHLFEKLRDQLANEQDITKRDNFNGHVTASALVINQDKEVLVVFHNKLQKYLQPGGHIEGVDASIQGTSLRELVEETGIKNAKLHVWCLSNRCPILIDTHYIPENSKKNEREHHHHDFMFIYNVDSSEVYLDNNEVSGFRWVKIEDLENEDSNVAKAINKIKKLSIL